VVTNGITIEGMYPYIGGRQSCQIFEAIFFIIGYHVISPDNCIHLYKQI